MKLREHLPQGYRAANGYRFTSADCESYNRIQDDINAWIRASRPIPEHLLKWSHRRFCEITGMQGF